MLRYSFYPFPFYSHSHFPFSSFFSRRSIFFPYSKRERCRGNNYLLAVRRSDYAVIRCGSMGTNYGEPSDGWSNQSGLSRSSSIHQVTRRLQRSASNYRQQQQQASKQPASFEISSNLVSLCYDGVEASINQRADCVLILRRAIAL